MVDTCGRKLLTPYGLRSLAPDDPDYARHYGGDPAFTPRGYFAQVWSVAEVLRAWDETDQES